MNPLRHAGIYLFVALCAPWVARWAGREEGKALTKGRPLSESEQLAARRRGVLHPGRIRVVAVDTVPMPGGPTLHRLAARIGFDHSTTCGLSLRYGIFLRHDFVDDPVILLHECVHTAQYERLGSLSAFMRCYLFECLRDGYHQSALEKEAQRFSGPMAGDV